jgi:hypothetical protein
MGVNAYFFILNLQQNNLREMLEALIQGARSPGSSDARKGMLFRIRFEPRPAGRRPGGAPDRAQYGLWRTVSVGPRVGALLTTISARVRGPRLQRGLHNGALYPGLRPHR